MIAVLHDLNHAFRYADNLIMMKSGNIIATGAPKDIVTEALIEDPISGTPLVIPKGRE